MPWLRSENKGVELMFCGKCGERANNEDRFCGFCGAAIDNQPGFQPDYTSINQTSAYQPVYTKSNTKTFPRHMMMPLLALLICVILWFVAPFVAVNYLTMGDQPSAFQLVTDDVTLLGDVADTIAFKAAVITMIGIIACSICAFCKKGTALRVISALTAVVLIGIVFYTLSKTRYDFGDMFGFGYIGICILFLVACFTPGKKHSG